MVAERTLQGSLTFLGFAIGILAVFYFAIEYIPHVSEWTQLAALILMALSFAFLGVYLRGTVVGAPFFDGPRLRWLRPSIVLYLLALFTGIVAEIRFLNIDSVPKPVKILASLLIGIGLIVGVARRRPASNEEGPEPKPPRVAPPPPPPPRPVYPPSVPARWLADPKPRREPRTERTPRKAPPKRARRTTKKK